MMPRAAVAASQWWTDAVRSWWAEGDKAEWQNSQDLEGMINLLDQPRMGNLYASCLVSNEGSWDSAIVGWAFFC